MNRTPKAPVSYFVLLAVSIPWSACTNVEGGSIEAAWVINTDTKKSTGVRIDCDCARVAAMRLQLLPLAKTGGDPCGATDGGGSSRCEFDCERGVGTTNFFIPAGQYAIGVVPVDLEGRAIAASAGVSTPPPVAREVISGELTNLGVNLIVVEQRRLAGKPACADPWLDP